MADENEGDRFHVITRQSQATDIVVHLPSFCKPLAASVRPYGGGEAGILASYYDPEQHSWVVRQLPLHEAWPHRPPPMLIVRVVALVDPADLYELRVTLASVLDGIDNDALYALQRRSQLYGLLTEEHLADKSGATLRAAREQGQLPHLSEALTLAAPLEVMEGFVMTGGGFISDFPVLREGPALTRSMQTVYDDVLAGDVLCGPPLPASNTQAAEEGAEYTAWSVTAAANAGLACFSLGLRRRSPLELARGKEAYGASDASKLHGNALLANAPTAFSGVGNAYALRASDRALEDSAHVQDPTGLVASRSSSDIAPLRQTTANSSAGAQRSLLETLMLRGQIEVKLSRKDGEEWHISLPPPHGDFSFAMGPNRELMTTARKTFYCE